MTIPLNSSPTGPRWVATPASWPSSHAVAAPQRRLRPGFAWIPLDIRNPHGVAAFAGIITMTPGTVSSDLSADGRFLLVHFLDLDDADAAVRDIKQRYEVPLMEVFP